MNRAVGSFFTVCLLLTVADSVAAQPSASVDPVQAIWKEQEISFYFQSFTTFYSCSSLEAKVKRILTAVGADPEMKIVTRGCITRHEIARIPHLEIKLVSPVEATPEALAELEKTRSTRELVARVRGELEEAAAAEEQFPAQWQSVSLSRRKLYLDSGDCELVEQLKDKVFPKLAIRVDDDDLRCASNQTSIAQPKLVVEALFPLPKPDEE